VLYTFVHDGLVHRRFPFAGSPIGYLKRLVQAHRLHHAVKDKMAPFPSVPLCARPSAS
jgi:beta-carotene 3-hydroxylase